MQPLQGSLLHGTALSGLQPAWPSLQPQRRRPELAPACSTRRPLINVVAPESRSTVPAAGGTSPPPPHQQHAQPPHAGSQQLGQSDGSREGEFLNILRKARPPPRQQRAAPPRRPGSPNSGDGSSGSGSSSSSSRAPASAAAVTGTPATSTPAAAKLAPAAGDSTAAAPAPPPASEAGVGKEDTEVIFRLERRGDGWAEEILPHLVVEQRPLKKKKRAYSRPDPWKEGSLECYLVDCGVPADDVDRVVTQAVAWRVTPGGRFLIDRRRRSRVERNVRLVVEHLEVECGVPPGPGGVAAILARCPEIMLCKPTTNDRWDRRAVELSAYLLRNGHCNVPEDWEESIELGLWVKRQRISRAAGQLSEERLSILQSMDFAFGEVAQMTEEWEHRFDQLVDWIIWHNENQQPFSWLGSDWGARGGITARELALWTTLQREYRARGLLPAEALSRFDAIGMLWDAPDGAPADRQWMAWFGRLLYLIERHNVMQPTRHHFLGRSLRGRPKGARTNGGGSVNGGLPEGEQSSDSSDEEEEQREGEGGEAGTEHGKVLSGGGRRRGEGAAVSAARQRLQAEMLARRSALAAADLRSEPGLRFWIARQLRRWRAQQLPGELALMLQLAGVQLDPYTPVQWQALAHSAAALLQGSQITLDPRTQQQLLAQQRRPAVAAAAAAGTNGGRLPLPAGQSEAPARTAVAVAEQSGGSKLATLSAVLDGKQQQQQQQQQQVDMECIPGSTRLRAARWVQTQQALFAEGKLSGGQLRYMAFLGITWVLSEEVYGMSEGQWLEWCGRLADAPRPLQRGSELWEWLQHQRGLHALGWLPLRRIRALAPLQVRLDSFDRCASEDAWDRQLSELLAFKAEHRHCRLLLAAGPAAAAAAQAPAWIQDEQQRQRWVPLAAWLAEQHRLLAANRLSLQQATQLAAIGAVPPPVKAAQP